MSADISFQTVFDLLQKQNASINELWRFYSTVVLALLAAVVGSDKLKATKAGIFCIMGGFGVFALGNLVVLIFAQKLYIQLAAIASQLAKTSGSLQALSITSIELHWVIGFHLACDLALLIAIYFMGKKSWEAAAQTKLVSALPS